jgi:hypothetical protein
LIPSELTTRGLVAYWEIPAGEKTAVKGKWVKVPVDDFLGTLKKIFTHLPIVSESSIQQKKASLRCGKRKSTPFLLTRSSSLVSLQKSRTP